MGQHSSSNTKGPFLRKAHQSGGTGLMLAWNISNRRGTKDSHLRLAAKKRERLDPRGRLATRLFEGQSVAENNTSERGANTNQ